MRDINFIYLLTEEDIDRSIEYRPKQTYIFKMKDDKQETIKTLTKDEFDSIINDPNLISFKRKERVSHKDDTTPSTKKGSFDDVSKSSYEPGKVHAISFKTMEPDASKKTGLHPRKMITIYRKISDQEYNSLKSARIFFNIKPSDESEHSEDVYNVVIPKELYGSRQGKPHDYFVYIPLDQVNRMSEDDKKRLRLELVPLSQIKDVGIGRKQITNDDVKNFLANVDKKVRRVDYKKSNEPASQYYVIDKKGGKTNVVKLTDKEYEKKMADINYTSKYDLEKIEKDFVKPAAKDVKPDVKEPKKKISTSKEASEFVKNNDNTIETIISRYQKVKDPIKKIKSEMPDASEEEVIKRLGGGDKTSLESMNNKIKELVSDIKKQNFKTQEDILKVLKDKFKGASSLSVYNKIENEITSQEIKEHMKKRVKEMSGTGGAGGSVPAPGSATANPGSGEGMATKYAFGGAGADPKKKKKKKSLMEDANDPAVAKAHFKYETLKGYVMTLNIKKGIEDINKVKEVYSALDKINNEVAKLADKYEGKDDNTFKELDGISENMIKLDNILADMISIIEKAQKNPVK